MPRLRFGSGPWNLEPPGVAKLMDKLRVAGVPLKEFAGVGPLYGVKTGCNEAFVVERGVRDRLIAEHPSSTSILKPFLRGRDIDRWRVESQDLWLVYVPWHFPCISIPRSLVPLRWPNGF